MWSEVPGARVGCASWSGVREDVAVLWAPGAAAAVTTRSTAAAASCRWTRARSPGRCSAVVVNSGNANAATGAQGERDNAAMAAAAAAALGCPVDEVWVCSTGVIGQPLDMGRLLPAVREACALDADRGRLARAIMTTDTRPKQARWSGAVQVAGVAKGSGMIHPDMATMLGFAITDARVAPADLQALLEEVTEVSFNAITVDGDCSTNDTFIVQSTGTGPRARPGDDAWDALRCGLTAVATSLARAIAADGEGAEHLIEVVVEGLADDRRARRAARAVAGSSLVKAAVYGRDANWGRVVAALGQAGVPDLDRLELDFAGVPVLRGGAPVPVDEAAASAALAAPEVRILARLPGPGRGVAWGCDLTEGYVKINADYRS